MKIIDNLELVDDRKLAGTFKKINNNEYLIYDKNKYHYTVTRVGNNKNRLIKYHNTCLINGQYNVDDNFIVFEFANNEMRCYEKALYSIKDNAIINFLSKYKFINPVFERVFTLKDNEQDEGINVMQIKARKGDVTFYITLPNYELLPYAYSSLRNKMIDVKSAKDIINLCIEDIKYNEIINYFCSKMNYDLDYAEQDVHLLGK